jgi:hypothetical protein
LDNEIKRILSWKNSAASSPTGTKVSMEEVKSIKQKIGGFIKA